MILYQIIIAIYKFLRVFCLVLALDFELSKRVFVTEVMNCLLDCILVHNIVVVSYILVVFLIAILDVIFVRKSSVSFLRVVAPQIFVAYLVFIAPLNLLIWCFIQSLLMCITIPDHV